MIDTQSYAGGVHQPHKAAKLGGPVSAPYVARRRPRRDKVIDGLFSDESDGFALVDLQGRVVQTNGSFNLLIGAAEGELIWEIIPNQCSDLQEALRLGRRAQSSLIIHVFGVRRFLLLTLMPFSPGKAILRVVDNTYQQGLKDQLYIARRFQALGELTGGVAHDFNNLLTVILGAADDLIIRAAGRPDDEAALDVVRLTARRGAALVSKLLREDEHQSVQQHVTSLNDFLKSSRDMLTQLLGSEITYDPLLGEPDDLHVGLDPTDLERMLVNLVVNAKQAMPRGGRLTISTTLEQISSQQLFGTQNVSDGEYACLKVKDSGVGMPPEVLSQVHNPFFSTKRDVGGTGMGLFIVSAVVNKSSGYMRVESAVDQGTEFVILLPAIKKGCKQPVCLQPSREEKSPQRSARKLIFLVDDDCSVRALAYSLLSRAGWEVLSASSAEEALERIEGESLLPILSGVVSDVMMPGIDGPTMVRKLRQRRPSLPAILMSGYIDRSLRTFCLDEDVSLLVKPFATEQMGAALEKIGVTALSSQ